MNHLIEVARANPFGASVVALVALVFIVAWLWLGVVVLDWVFRGVVWALPRLEAVSLFIAELVAGLLP